MYGVPKFRENIFMKYKKEVLLSVGAVVSIASLVRFMPSPEFAESQPIDNEIDNRVVIEEVKPIIGYKVIINGTEVGLIEDESSIGDLVQKAYDSLVAEIGYDPEVSVEPALIPAHDGELTLDSSEIIESLKNEFKLAAGTIKTKAFVMRIGDDFTVTLASEDDIKDVLCRAQEKIVNTDAYFEVDFDENEHSSMIKTPKLLMLDPSSLETSLSTSSSESGEDSLSAEESVSEEALALNAEALPQAQEIEAEVKEEVSDEQVQEEEVDEDEAKVEEEPGTLMEIEFAEDIAVVEAFVEPSDIVDVATAVEMITKENEEEKIYTVENGDSPWLIASQNDMSLDDLYKMNPDLKDNEKYMQVGDEVVIMVPEPELKVETKVEIVYTEPIYRETVYVDDPDTYVGSSSVIDNGSDGVMEVTAVVTQLNGEEIDREITGKERVVEPANKVVSKGSKPFPVKGATGSYIYPVSGFVITSPYGYRRGSFHHGVDLALASGNPIVAADGGTVVFAGWKSSIYGYAVEIDHGDGVLTRYAHCSKVSVSVGQAVSKGEEIAKVGSTGRSSGPHVHFEIRFDGVAANPIDYLD